MLRPTISKALLLALLFSVTQTPSCLAAAAVKVGERIAFVVSAGSGGKSAEQCAAVAQENLHNALAASLKKGPGAAGIVNVKGVHVVTLGGYQVAIADEENARAEGVSSEQLAQRWCQGLKKALADGPNLDRAMEQLAAAGSSATPGVVQEEVAAEPLERIDPVSRPQGDYIEQARAEEGVMLPAGAIVHATLRTTITSASARIDDTVEAQIERPPSDGSLPKGTVLLGRIVQADDGRCFNHSGSITIRFERLRLPEGTELFITAHIVGKIGRYRQVGGEQSGKVIGEGWAGKLGHALIRTAAGAGSGAAWRFAMGGLSGQSSDATARSALTGATIGGGLAATDSLVMRQGKDVEIGSGEEIQIKLDQNVHLPNQGLALRLR